MLSGSGTGLYDEVTYFTLTMSKINRVGKDFKESMAIQELRASLKPA